MKTTLTWVIAASLLGAVGGVALGYWEARPWTIRAPGETTAKDETQSAASDKNTSGPKATIGETTYRFGKMESGTKQQRTFPVRNAGDKPLNIEFVSHTCKCTTVKLDGKPVEPGATVVVQPGEETGVFLEWAAKVAPGPFRHGATFTTNDPALSRIELVVEGDVVESTALYPSSLNFGRVRVGQPAAAELFVMAFLEPEVEVLDHHVLDDKLAERVEIKIEPATKEGLPSPEAQAGVKIIATYTPSGSIGPFEGSLELKTNIKQAPDLAVPIYGRVEGDISIVGKGWTEASGMLRMGPATSASGTSSKLNVAVRGPHAAATKLSVASVDPAELKVSLGEPDAIRENLVWTPLTVEIPPGTRGMVRAGEDQGGEGSIVLATTHPDTPEIRLRVTFTVKP
jgi:hypothetical protein